jgi:hypothetical protein
LLQVEVEVGDRLIRGLVVPGAIAPVEETAKHGLHGAELVGRIRVVGVEHADALRHILGGASERRLVEVVAIEHATVGQVLHG